MSLKCRRCGAVWPPELETAWGQTRETQAYGPDVKCVAIVKDPRTGSGSVCGGRLLDVEEATDRPLTHIDGRNIHQPATPAAAGAQPVEG